MADGLRATTEAAFARFRALTPVPVGGTTPEPVESYFGAEKRILTLAEAEDDEPLDPARSAAMAVWLPRQGRFVPWGEWRGATWPPSDPPIVDPHALPRDAVWVEAECSGARIQLRRQGDHFDRWLWDRKGRRWRRQKGTATPFLEHARRWAEEVYGPPREPWIATRMYRAKTPKAKAEAPG